VAEGAALAGVAAVDTAAAGVADLAAGADELGVARGAASLSAVAGLAAASDLTRAVDAEVVADRLAMLGQVVAEAGINDLGQGADLLSVSDDVDAISALVGLMSLGDLERGLQLGRLAGELKTISNVVAELEMPILSAVLADRGSVLQGIARDVILRGAATRALSQTIEATGTRLADLGVEEIDEGELRLLAADIALQRSNELAAAGLAVGLRGAAEAEVAGDAMTVAGVEAGAGVADAAFGAAELGAAKVEAGVAESLDELAE
jgi:hypothetical protein